MIKEISQLEREETMQTAALVVSNNAYRQHFFPGYETEMQIADILCALGREWNVIDRGKILAAFTVETSRTLIKFDRVCIEPSSTDEIAAEISNLALKTPAAILAPPELEDALTKLGYERQEIQIRLSKNPRESRIMQLHPLSNPNEKDIPELSRLMFEAYAVSKYQKYTDLAVAERSLIALMAKKERIFLQSSSFISKAGDKIISACLVTREHIGATISELFTHPLYRARGLATAELITCMNSLARARIPLLRVTVGEKNDHVLRLLSKLGFSEDTRATLMTRGCPNRSVTP